MQIIREIILEKFPEIETQVFILKIPTECPTYWKKNKAKQRDVGNIIRNSVTPNLNNTNEEIQVINKE